MPKNYWLPKDERGIRAQTAAIRELREEIEDALETCGCMTPDEDGHNLDCEARDWATTLRALAAGVSELVGRVERSIPNLLCVKVCEGLDAVLYSKEA